MKDLGTKLFYLRTLAKWTQEHVAKKIGVSKTIYLGFERNASNITIARLNKIISLYGITLADFFAFSEADVNAFIKGKTPVAVKREFFPQFLAAIEVMNKLLCQLLQQSSLQTQALMKKEKSNDPTPPSAQWNNTKKE